MKPRAGIVEAIPFDEAHGVEWPAVGVATEAVDRHDAGMLQAASDLGFEQETHARFGIVGVPGLDLLERDLAFQFLIERDGYLTQSASRVRPQHREAARGRARTRDGCVRID